MTLEPDKIMHLKLGAALAALLALIVLVALYVGPGYAVAFGAVAFGIGVELYQKIHDAGVPSLADAAASAAAGVAGGLLYELVRWVNA
jgi:hypothetical protein